VRYQGVRRSSNTFRAGTFLELLEPYILKDTLRGLAPAVMQALVEHYSEKGWLQRVEQCILHMNIASLDFNQVMLVLNSHFVMERNQITSFLQYGLALVSRTVHSGYKCCVQILQAGEASLGLSALISMALMGC
jgi:hypothetical protein